MPIERKNGKAAPTSDVAEPWEVEDVHAELPSHSYNEITEAVSYCKKKGLGKKRKDLLECVRRKFA